MKKYYLILILFFLTYSIGKGNSLEKTISKNIDSATLYYIDCDIIRAVAIQWSTELIKISEVQLIISDAQIINRLMIFADTAKIRRDEIRPDIRQVVRLYYKGGEIKDIASDCKLSMSVNDIPATYNVDIQSTIDRLVEADIQQRKKAAEESKKKKKRMK